MNKIKNFQDYIKENILFPRGGNIGGEHKKTVTDKEIESGKAHKKGYVPQPKGVTHHAHQIEDEKRKQRKINLMGSELRGYYEREFIERLIDAVKNYQLEYDRNPKNIYYHTIIDFIKVLPVEVIEHFDIDINSENLVEDFIENKYELFKRSYYMFKEIKDYSVRYGE